MVPTANALFFDGVTPTPVPVTCAIIGDALHIRRSDGGSQQDWPVGRLRLTEDLHPGQPIRLRQKGGGMERLVLEDPALFDELRAQVRPLRRRDYRHGGNLRRGLFWLTVLGLVVVGLWRGWPLAVEPIATLVPVSLEEKLGAAVQEQVTKLFAARSKVCTGAAGRKALDRLVTRLGSQVPHPYTLRVTVVNHKMVNAFAAPGGYIVIFRGLIDSVPGPDSLAGVLAHEIGHVIERHVVENLIQGLGISIVLKTMAGDSSGVVGQASDVATTLIVRGYGRSAEREADQVAVRILNKANIRGEGLAAFFRMVAKKQGDRPESLRYLSTHPPSLERAAAARAAATGTQPSMPKADWDAIKNMCK